MSFQDFNGTFSDMNWLLQGLILILIPVAFTLVIAVLRFFCWRISGDHLRGSWREFHYTFDTTPTIIETEWQISMGFFSRYRILSTTNEGVLKYRGSLLKEQGHLSITLRRENETLVYRFVDPIPSKTMEMTGIWLSYDYDNQICAGASLFTNNSSCSQEEAINKIKQSIETSSDGLVFRVR